MSSPLPLEVACIAPVEIDVTRDLSMTVQPAYRRLHGLLDSVVREGHDARMQRVHFDDRQRVNRTVLLAVAGIDATLDVEYRIIKPDSGELRWIVTRLAIVRDPEGVATRLLGADIDITDQKRRELDVRDSELRMRTLADAVPQLIWTNDSQGIANYFNLRWYEYSGLGFEQSVGLGWQAIVHPDDAPASVDRWRAALAAGRVFDTEFRLRDADGAYRWFLGRNVPLTDVHGRVVGWFGSATEIDTVKRAQESAHASEARLRVTMESALDYAIITIDAHGIIIGWSNGAERAFQYSEAEVVGQHTRLIFTPEDRAQGAPEQEMGKALATGRAEDERWHLRRDGTRFYMSGVMAPICDPSHTGFVKVARDMTERRQAEDALKQSEVRYRELAEDLSRTKEALILADRQKDQFIATLAHELRNPLAPVASAMQLISMSGSTDPQVLWALDVVNRQTHSMARLIDDLMDVSRISQNKLMLRRERVELETVLRDALDITRPLVEQRGQRLDIVLPEEPVLLNGDATRLSQVFANLLDNAAKYTEPGGTLGLSVQVDAQAVVVRVADSGIGIAPENVGRIFDLFSQVRTSRDRGKGGLGIGLSLVRQLVGLHGGTITVDSEGEGRGSVFTVRLPLAADVPALVRPSVDDLAQLERDAAVVLVGRRVLVVDDNVDAADAFKALLTQSGCIVSAVYDGDAALEAAESFRPDIVLMDIGLPKRTGHEVAEAIRAEPWGVRMILIAISGWGTEEEKRRSYAAGFDRHLVKPVEPRRLMTVMAELWRGESVG